MTGEIAIAAIAMEIVMAAPMTAGAGQCAEPMISGIAIAAIMMGTVTVIPPIDGAEIETTIVIARATTAIIAAGTTTGAATIVTTGTAIAATTATSSGMAAIIRPIGTTAIGA